MTVKPTGRVDSFQSLINNDPATNASNAKFFKMVQQDRFVKAEEGTKEKFRSLTASTATPEISNPLLRKA